MPKSIAGNCLLQQQKLDNVSSSANNKIAFIWLCEIIILAVFSVFWPVVCLHSELIFLTAFAYDAHFHLSRNTSFRFEKREKAAQNLPRFETKNGPDFALYSDRYTQVFRSISVADLPKSIAGNCLQQQQKLPLTYQIYSDHSQLIRQHIGKLLIGQIVKCLIIPVSKIVAISDSRDVTNNYGVDVIGHAIITHICARLMQKVVHTVPVLLVEAKYSLFFWVN